MALLIRGGTVVNADFSRRADVLVEGERIVAVGENLEAPAGAEIVDAGGALRHAGRHRSAHPHGAHVHGHRVGGRFRVGHQGGALRRHHHDRRFLHSGTRPVPRRGLSRLAAQIREGGRATIPSTWPSPGGRTRSRARWARSSNTHGVNTFKHFMAYKGALMVDDDVLFRSFKRCAELGATALVHAENGDVVAQMQEHVHRAGQDRPGVPCLFAAARGRRRGREPGHHDRRHGGLPALHRPHLLRSRRTRRSRGQEPRASASSASR